MNIVGHPAELTEEIEESLLRIFQEAVANIGRHANASAVEAILSFNRGNIELKVHDNGTGFDTRNKKQGAFGIIDMKERVSLLKGKINIESKSGQGTTVTAIIPI